MCWGLFSALTRTHAEKQPPLYQAVPRSQYGKGFQGAVWVVTQAESWIQLVLKIDLAVFYC